GTGEPGVRGCPPGAGRALDESNTRPARAPRAPGEARRAAPARASPAAGIRSAAGNVARIRDRNGSSSRASGTANSPPSQDTEMGVDELGLRRRAQATAESARWAAAFR